MHPKDSLHIIVGKQLSDLRITSNHLSFVFKYTEAAFEIDNAVGFEPGSPWAFRPRRGRVPLPLRHLCGTFIYVMNDKYYWEDSGLRIRHS